MLSYVFVICVLSLSGLTPVQNQTGPPQVALPIPVADGDIKAETLRQHVQFLASDALRGRMTGTRGAEQAAQYIARVLEDAGLQPAGDDGTFFQRVPLIAYDFESNPTLTVEEQDGSTWRAEQGSDFRLRVRGAPDAPARLLVQDTAHFAAYLEGGSSVRASALFVAGRRTQAADALAALDLGSGEGLGLVLLEGSRRAGRTRPMRSADLVALSPGPDPADQVIANGRLLAALQEGRVVAVTLHASARVQDRSCQNVVGLLGGVGSPGRPELAREVIVLSAHYDHIGVKPEAADEAVAQASATDLIYNGADDDASGVAAVLEIAAAFGTGPPPARTLVVLLATGEERGLLGTRVYLDRPAVPLDRTLFNLNLEMIGRPDPLLAKPGDLWLTGWEETTLGPSLAGGDQPLSRDPRPEQNFYQRSDNIAFVRRGIMGQTLSSYGMHTDYHHVTDETETLDFTHLQLATENALRVARALLVDAIAVDWGNR